MSYEYISKELIKEGFYLNNMGSPEIDTKDINLAFVEHPFYHVIMYTKKSHDKRTVYVPGELKLPKVWSSEDILYAIKSLLNGEDENKIIMNLFQKNNPEEVKENTKKDNKLKFEIKQTIGTLSESSKGWKKELNLISWNDKEPKYDLRDWDADHKKIGKGITLSKEELKKLKGMLNGMELDKSTDNGIIYGKILNIIFADVLYTMTDETFYVLDGISKYSNIYKANSMVEMIEVLKKDGWCKCGKVNRSDYSAVDMLDRNGEYIAIWEE